MSFQKSGRTLKNEVLEICGELTDGTSQYDTIAMQRINDLYQGLLTGGNEFGVDVGEPWTWAHARRNILLALLPENSTGTVTLTQNSSAGTFSSAPSTSMAGRHLAIESRADVYRIVTHTAGATAFTLDMPYIEDSGVMNFKAYKLDYELFDDSVLIDSTNNKFDFRDGSSSTLAASLTGGLYTTTAFAAHLKTQMQAVGGFTYTITFDADTRKFTISTSGTHLDLYFKTGTNVLRSTADTLGFLLDDYTDSTTYTADIPLNAITRLTKPLAIYREAPSYWTSSKDTGKVFAIDANTFLKEFPLNRIRLDIPDRYCVINETPSGIKTIRINTSVAESIRCEASYIPVTGDIIDSESSFPKIPGIHSKYLVYGAANFIMIDKSDNRAESYKTLASAKLQAMVADNRKQLSLGGKDFGRLIPRRGHIRTWNYHNRN